MRKHNRSCSVLATAKNKYHFGTNIKLGKSNKRGYSAEGYSLLTSALRPRLFGVVAAIGLVAITGTTLVINDNSVSAANATLTIPEGISVNVDASKDNGFAKSDNESVSVSTGNLAGYTLSIKSSNDNKLRNGDNVLNSITETVSEDSYKDGNNYVNTWGFKPSTINNNDNTSYIPGPTSSGIILAKTNISSSSNENYSLAIAAKVDNSLIAGNYTNTFTLTATANEAWYTINYDTESLSGATNADVFIQDHNLINSDTIAINPTEPTKEGTDFLGWCDEPLQEDGTCKGSTIQAGGNLRLCKCDTDVTLYAMWGKKGTDINEDKSDGADCRYGNLIGKRYGNLCWMWEDNQSVDVNRDFTYDGAAYFCRSFNHGWSMPTKEQFETLINAAGSQGELYGAGWGHKSTENYTYGHYWTSTPYSSYMGTTSYYYFEASPDRASVSWSASGSNSRLLIRCVTEGDS